MTLIERLKAAEFYDGEMCVSSPGVHQCEQQKAERDLLVAALEEVMAERSYQMGDPMSATHWVEAKRRTDAAAKAANQDW